jgi:hypothetical protein
MAFDDYMPAVGGFALDPEEERRRLLATTSRAALGTAAGAMPPVSANTADMRYSGATPGPLRDLIQNPRNLLMPPAQSVPVAGGASQPRPWDEDPVSSMGRPGLAVAPGTMAPASAAPIGPAQQKYQQDLAAGPQVPQRTTGQKILRGLESVGVGLLDRNNPVGTAIRFYKAPEAQAREDYKTQLGAEKTAADEERAASREDIERRNIESEINARENPAAKPAAEKSLTPEETTLHDLMTGNGGQPRVNPQTKQPYTYLEAYQAVKQAGERPAAAGGEKVGEYKPYTVPGSDVPILAAQQGNKLLTREGKELPSNAVPYVRGQGGYGEPGGDPSLSGEAYLRSLDPPERAIVQEIGTGRAAPDRIAYILARNPKLTGELALAFPDLDTSKLMSYVSTYKDFTSGPASVAINAGNTALLHLKELRDLNTDKSRIPGTSDYQKYQNKLDTISSELARFYGNNTVEGIAGYRKTLGATFNRDAAIVTQAQSMGDKLDAYENQWKNAAPSAAYQAPLPGISEAAKKARAALDPNYSYASPDKPAGGATAAGTSLVDKLVKKHGR